MLQRRQETEFRCPENGRRIRSRWWRNMQKRQDVGCCFAEVRFLRPQNGLDFRPSKSARLSTCLFLLQAVLANEIRAPGLMKYDRGASLETARRRPPRQMPSTRASLAKRVASAQPTSFARSAFVRAGGTRATLALLLL